MYEAKIICPKNAEAPGNARKALKDAIEAATNAFGGVTITEGYGSWKNDAGKVIAEPVAILTMACEDSPANRDAIDDIAIEIGATARQDCVYVKYPNGHVTLLQTDYLWT